MDALELPHQPERHFCGCLISKTTESVLGEWGIQPQRHKRERQETGGGREEKGKGGEENGEGRGQGRGGDLEERDRGGGGEAQGRGGAWQGGVGL